ncbi:inhibitor of growth protein 2 isoform X2 [Agrilus planipennis]|uniref:Inhibitor of growth protein 2 isoform X2 n=1 Tax=Agrilus planipennis TaxID=224129 RepID=A0A1W4WU85_AGRPL|nr:inhibitor of growth protein 2 isoform X2 [Agrilus planipennis]
MLNQVSVEAVYSATYVENYLDCVENLPDDLQRLISRMRELDVYYLARVREAEYQCEIWRTISKENLSKKTKSFARMQQALIAAQELGDEKMNLLQSILDKIEMKTRLLNQDFKNLDFGKEESTVDTKEQQPTSNNTSTSTSLCQNERPIKRLRRTRHDTLTGIDPISDGNSGDLMVRNQTNVKRRNANHDKSKHLNAKILLPRKKRLQLIQMNLHIVCVIKFHLVK